MADIDLTRIHNLGLAAARAKAERMADQLGQKFGLKGVWEGNVLRFDRPGVSGSLAITDKDLRLLVTLGFLFKAMKGSIENAVKHELDTLFAGPVVAEHRPNQTVAEHRSNQTSEAGGVRHEKKASAPAPAPATAKRDPPLPKKGG
jgi:putative polyhydroxyalkanoate system protein